MSLHTDVTDRAGSPPAGPSDSSDSPSDLPEQTAATDTDRQGTGARPAATPGIADAPGGDIAPDQVVEGDGAGLSRSPPDAARNGGRHPSRADKDA